MTPDAMAALHAQCFPDRAWSVAEFEDLMRMRGTLRLTDPSAHGFLLARLLPPEAEILTLAVAPGARRQGIGTALVSALLDRLPDDGVTQLFLEVSADNDAARSLYQGLHFLETGRRRDYYRRTDGRHADALLMARAVPAGATP